MSKEEKLKSIYAIIVVFIALLTHSKADALIVDAMEIVWQANSSEIGGDSATINYVDGDPIVKEGLDEYDSIHPGFHPMSPYDIHTMIYSVIPGSYKLKHNFILLNYYSKKVELSLISRDGSPVSTQSVSNGLTFKVIHDNNFGSYRIFISECNPDDPNHIYWREEISDVRNGTLTINLPELNGTYQSEEVIHYLHLTFTNSISDINGDNIVDFKDWTYLARNYETNVQNPEEQRYLLGDISGPLDVPDMTVDMNDLIKFVQEWLEIK